jgi:hypothetical protein
VLPVNPSMGLRADAVRADLARQAVRG